MRRIAASLSFVLTVSCATASTILNPRFPPPPKWTTVAVTQEELLRDSTASRRMRVTERDGSQRFLTGPHVEGDSLIGACSDGPPGLCRVAVALRNLRSLERETTTAERSTVNLTVVGLSLLVGLVCWLGIQGALSGGR